MLFAEILMLALIYSQLQACAKNAVLAQNRIRLNARNDTTTYLNGHFRDPSAFKFSKYKIATSQRNNILNYLQANFR